MRFMRHSKCKNKTLKSNNITDISQEVKFKDNEDKIKDRDQDFQSELINFCQFLQEN